MITPMTKYSLVMLAGDEGNVLEAIQKLGLMDIKRVGKAIDEKSSQLLTRAQALKAKIADIKNGNYNRDSEYCALTEALNNAQKERKERSPWGEFDTQKIAGLEKLGLKIRFYCVPSGKFSTEWIETYALEIIHEDGKNIYFVTISPLGGEYDFPVHEIAAPSGSIKESDALIAELSDKLKERISVLDAEINTVDTLNNEYLSLINELELYLAAQSGEMVAENSLCTMTGFAPSADDKNIAEELDCVEGLYYSSEPACKEDNPPIKLRNNWFARQFESLTGMYGMPLYDEWDATPILAPFFLLFFAMCMGDAGYGLLMIGIAYAFKSMKGDGPMGLGKFWKLIRTLGIGTFVAGIFLGTFFGIDLSAAKWVPEALKSVMLTGNIGNFPTQMVMAIGIGVFHICLAMIVKSLLYTQRFGFKQTISTWGWTLLIVGSIIAFGLAAIVDLPSEITKWIIIGIAAVSVLGIFIFNTPGRNPLINIGAGLWDTYQMVTGLLGDVLSYIRLYALGLAGGMLGSAFNTLGGLVLGESPTFQWIFFILIVVLGHALNLAMSCLGAFVHPLRLTFVEYFKNAGYEGKGVEYNPLKEIK